MGYEVETFSPLDVKANSARMRGRVYLLPATWPDGDGYIYRASEHEEMWVAGYSQNNGSQYKGENYLYAYANLESGQSGVAIRTWVTDEKVDVSGFNSIYIDWQGGPGISAKHFIFLENKGDNQNSYVSGYRIHRTFFSGNFARTTQSIDISGLSGEYFVAVMNESYMTGGYPSYVYVYNVWLE